MRVRITNTDNGPMQVWTSRSFRLLAVDGTEVNRPTQVSDRAVTLTAGARADIEIQVPAGRHSGQGAAVQGDGVDHRTAERRGSCAAAAWR